MPIRMDPADDMLYPLFFGLPLWVREPFVYCFRSWSDQYTSLRLAMEAIRIIEEQQQQGLLIQRWFEAPIYEIPPDLPGEFKEMVERGRFSEVTEVIRRSERVLLSEALVMLWGTLETVIEDLLVRWYEHNPSALIDDRAKQIKVSLAEFEAKNVEERGKYLIDQLKQKLGSNEKASINRFESLLNAFGLSSAVDRSIGRMLLEVGHIRNVLIHRAGFADRRLVEACPWLNLTIDRVVPLSQEQYINYLQAAQQYIELVVQRLYPEFGWEAYTDEAGTAGWRRPGSS